MLQEVSQLRETNYVLCDLFEPSRAWCLTVTFTTLGLPVSPPSRGQHIQTQRERPRVEGKVLWEIQHLVDFSIPRSGSSSPGFKLRS